MNPNGKPVLDVQKLRVGFAGGRRGWFEAVSGVSFQVRKGETLGLVGESGCGKSSAARAVMMLPKPDGGKVYLNGTELTTLSARELKRLRPVFQMILQDSVSAMNPRRNVGNSIAAPLAVMNTGTRRERQSRAKGMLEQVGLPSGVFECRPHELSGGQCQRVQIARALVTRPELLICDEPVSSLDVSIQAQILNLLEDMRLEYGLTMVFISHDLSVVKNVSDRIAVMYLGKFCETAPSEVLYRQSRHPYTRALLESVPSLNLDGQAGPDLLIRGEFPSPADPPSGCRFRIRCPLAEPRCAEQEPVMRMVGREHMAACHKLFSRES